MGICTSFRNLLKRVFARWMALSGGRTASVAHAACSRCYCPAVNGAAAAVFPCTMNGTLQRLALLGKNNLETGSLPFRFRAGRLQPSMSCTH